MVREKPKKAKPLTSKERTDPTAQVNEANGMSEETKKSELKERDVEANDVYDSGPGETTDDDEKTTNTNNEGKTTVAEEDAVEEDKGGLCSGGFFDNICGKNEQGIEAQEKKNDHN